MYTNAYVLPNIHYLQTDILTLQLTLYFIILSLQYLNVCSENSLSTDLNLYILHKGLYVQSTCMQHFCMLDKHPYSLTDSMYKRISNGNITNGLYGQEPLWEKSTESQGYSAILMRRAYFCYFITRVTLSLMQNLVFLQDQRSTFLLYMHPCLV